MGDEERKNPCRICGHDHKYEEGEKCGVCGHRLAVSDESAVSVSAVPSEILPEFLYLGTYAHAALPQTLQSHCISRVLNTVRTCPNLHKTLFTYHCLQDDQKLSFDDAIQFLELCEKDKTRVLVHCMSSKNRSPAIVIAYLMKSKDWKLSQSYQWVKERNPSVELSQVVYEQLQEYEQKLDSTEKSSIFMPNLPISFGFSAAKDPVFQQESTFNANTNAPAVDDSTSR